MGMREKKENLLWILDFFGNRSSQRIGLRPCPRKAEFPGGSVLTPLRHTHTQTACVSLIPNLLKHEPWVMRELYTHTHRLCELVSASSGGLLEGLCFQGSQWRAALCPLCHTFRETERHWVQFLPCLNGLKTFSCETWVREEKTTGLIEVP